MLTFGKVKSIAIGGQPNGLPMAVIGGVQGSQTLTFQSLGVFAFIASSLTGNVTWNTDNGAAAATELLAPLIADPPVNYDPTTSQLNFLNSFGGGDPNTNVPLQFQPPQKADCRLYNIADDLVSVVQTWDRIATGKYDCVAGKKIW
jgi:hypothetical protein